MGILTDHEIRYKSREIQKHAKALNALMRELAFEGCRVNCDVTTIDHSTMQWERSVPTISVDVYRRVSG